MMEFYECRERVARKTHKCEMCGHEIKPGERYQQETGKYCGDFFNRILHLSCVAVLSKYCGEVDNEFTYYDIHDWWAETRCRKCKNYYPPCNPDEYCSYPQNECPERDKSGRCTADDTCHELTRYCWCENYEKEN